jgi:predicted short-subunit dehydrogenase-like oxidoreductase (DUF2520 family)
MRTLTIIGGGKVGRTLGYLFLQTGRYRVKNILSKTYQTSLACQTFLGEGHAISNWEALEKADLILITVNDDQLTHAIASLATAHCLTEATVAFHCSGTFSHRILFPLQMKGVACASIHPIKSFSNPNENITNFTGTFCTLEGDELACTLLQDDFEAMGAYVLKISSENKIFYHIATIFSCNYLTALIDISLQLLQKNEISHEQGVDLLTPLIQGTLAQIKERGAAKTLTGPISRGDSLLIKQHCDALSPLNNDIATAYKILGKLTLALAIQDNRLNETVIEEIKGVLLS